MDGASSYFSSLVPPSSRFSTLSTSPSFIRRRKGRGGGRGRGRGRQAKITGNCPGSNVGSQKGGACDTSYRINALSKLFVRILRHMRADMNLDMRSDGYVRVKDLLKLNVKSRADVPLKSHSINEIREVVRMDNKQRFALLEENGQLLMRANQGHTVRAVESESLLRPITSTDDIPACVHGTYKRFLDSILGSGLKRMRRRHIHFSCGLPSDGEVQSGMRDNINAVIFLDVKKALKDGMEFYMSVNKVVLTEGFDGVIPVKYFDKVELWPSRKSVSIKTLNSDHRFLFQAVETVQSV